MVSKEIKDNFNPYKTKNPTFIYCYAWFKFFGDEKCLTYYKYYEFFLGKGFVIKHFPVFYFSKGFFL